MLVTYTQETRSTALPTSSASSTIKLTLQAYISRKRLYLSENLYPSSEDLRINCSLKTGADKNEPTTYMHSHSAWDPQITKCAGACSLSGNAPSWSSNPSPKQTLKYHKSLCRLSNSLNCDQHWALSYLSTLAQLTNMLFATYVIINHIFVAGKHTGFSLLLSN